MRRVFTRKNKNANANLPNLGKAYEELNRLPRNVPTGNLLGLNQPLTPAANRAIPQNLQNLFEQVGPFTAGVFLDNDPDHRASVQNACRAGITIIPVPETRFMRPSVRIASPSYVAFVEKLSEEGKAAAKVISRLCLIHGGSEALDNASGIQEQQVIRLKEWVDTESARNRSHLVAIFDFDRTLSMIEGGYFLADSMYAMKKLIVELAGKQEQLELYIPGLTVKGYAEYLAAGHERMAMLQDMFDYLYDHNVKVILLTNNGNCPKARNLFREIMMVYTRGRHVEIVCGVDFGGNKGAAVLGRNTNTGNLKSLRDMCIRRGGYRKSKRAIQKKRRTTRRR
jgi:hypothetical protein